MHLFLATDGSLPAQFVQAHIRALPWPPPVHVTVMMAVDVPRPRFTCLTPLARQAYGAALTALRQEAETRAKEVVAEARRALEPHVGGLATRVPEGPPGPVIVEAAKVCRADLVVVGSRGWGALRRVLSGSVSHHGVRHAPWSVLVVRS